MGRAFEKRKSTIFARMDRVGKQFTKISKDIGLAYRLGNIKIQYKEPNRVRMEGSLEGSRAIYVLNGAVQWTSNIGVTAVTVRPTFSRRE